MIEYGQIDIAWVLVSSVLVLVMQAGFLCLEAGSTRSKNSINVALKNLSDFALASLLFALFGYSIMFGATSAGWFGHLAFFGDSQLDPGTATFFVFEVMFCGTATTIVSGAVAERMRFGGYLMVAAVLSGLIYTVFGHWAWNGLDGSPTLGWLRELGFVDFAGSTVVHGVAGWSALALVVILGPREGRFNRDGGARRIPGHNLPFAMLGALLLWIGWLGFNGGSALALDDRVPGILANTVLAGSAGLMAALASSWLRLGRSDVMSVLNGSLAGLVAITAGCHAVSPTSAIVIGAVGGLVMEAGTLVLERARIDDVVSVIPVHAMAGAWGTLAVALFGDPALLGTGLGRLDQFGVQCLGVGACFLWSFGVTYLVFRTADRVRPLRVTARAEQLGLNVTEHGETTELLDLLVGLETQAATGDLSLRVAVEPFTEVGQIASRYNRVMDSLQEAVATAAAIVRDIRDGIITFRSDGTLLSFNPGAESIFGYSPAETLHQPVQMLFQDGAGASMLSAGGAETTVAEGSPLELDGIRRNGSRVPLEVRLSSGSSSGEQVYTGLIRDISDREEMDRMKNEFISTVSHELRTPLTSINASLGLLADSVGGELSADSRELVRIGRDNSERLVRLIGQILDIQKMEAGKQDYELRDLEIGPIVERVVDTYRALASESAVKLNFTDRSERGCARADEDRVIQVVSNLLSNALRFSARDSEIDVAAVHHDGVLRVSVTDHGHGIPETFRPRVFQKFAQADGSDSRKKGGTGLGLSICQAIIEDLGGKIGFETEIGEGTTFSFDLPELRNDLDLAADAENGSPNAGVRS
jgi:Amt family ammonium transporter